MLLGEFNYNLDAKGRVFVPAKLRESLGDSFVLAKSMDKCITLYSFEMWQRYVEKLSGIPEMRARSIRRFVFSTANEVTVDAQGRVVLSQPLREYAGLEKEVVIIGVGDHAEIWDAASWQGYMGDADVDNMVDILMEYGF